jgi:hypothetical protein
LIEATETAFWLLSFWSLSCCALCFIRPGLQELDHGLESRQSSWCFNPGERLLVLTVQFSQSTISCESTISCVSWGVKENQHHYSGSGWSIMEWNKCGIRIK